MMKDCQASGTITMSMPALTAVRTSVAVNPAAPSIWSMPFQSGDDEAGEAEFAFEHSGDQVLVAVHLHAVPRAVRDHDGADAALHRGLEAAAGGSTRSSRLGQLCVALVDAARRTAVADVVLGGGEHGTPGALSDVPCRPVTTVVIDEARSGVSPNDSYVRPHRSLRATQRQGAEVPVDAGTGRPPPRWRGRCPAPASGRGWRRVRCCAGRSWRR